SLHTQEVTNIRQEKSACGPCLHSISLGSAWICSSRRAAMEVDRDRAEVVATVIRFWQTYERKDLAALSNMITAADDFTFFGSDAAEVVKTRREWEELMRNDW